MQAPDTKEPPIERARVSTSGKTEGPRSPSFSKEDREYFRTHLLSEKPIARFDTFGTVGHVLSDIDRYVPQVFGSEGEKALTTLHRVLRHYAANEKWTYVVVSLSTGLARTEVEGLLSRKLGNSGPIIIDADASTEEHQLFGNETEARIQKERIIQANEATGKILLVLYAIDNPDGQKEREVALGSLQKVDAALGVLLEEDARLRSLWGIEGMDEDMLERLERIGAKLGEKEDPHAFGLHVMHALFMEMRGIETASALPIYMAIQRFGIIPSRWAGMGIVDDAAEMEEEIGRMAQEHRAKLARGWRSPEEKLREAAAHTEHQRMEATAHADEQRRHNPSAHRSLEAATEHRLHEEREARHGHEDSAAFARSRTRLLHREARDDKLHDEHMAEDARLESEESAAPPGEKSHYAHLRAEADEAFEVSEEQEQNIELRERRNEMNEERAGIEEGTAEGAYAGLAETAEELREDALDQRQRNEFALESRRESERDAVDIAEQQHDYAELREATPPQGEQAVERQEAREQQQEAQNERSEEIPPGAPRPQEEQANVLESEASKDAPGTLMQTDRAELLERSQPDEANNPQLTEERRVLVENSHMAPEGDLDPRWPQNEQHGKDLAAAEVEKQQQIQEQVAQASEPERPAAEDQRAQALAATERQEQESQRQERQYAEQIETTPEEDLKKQQDTQDRAEDDIKEVRKQVDRATEPLRDDDQSPELHREEEQLAAEAEGEREMNARERAEKRAEREAVVAFMEATTPPPQSMPDTEVTENPERVVDLALNRALDRKNRKPHQPDEKPAVTAENAPPPPSPEG